MSVRYASGKKAAGICDVCGFRYKLKELKSTTVKGRVTSTLACPTCWDKDHPQNFLGMYPVHDPQALRDPRTDRAEYAESRALILPVSGSRSLTTLGNITVSTP